MAPQLRCLPLLACIQSLSSINSWRICTACVQWQAEAGFAAKVKTKVKGKQQQSKKGAQSKKPRRVESVPFPDKDPHMQRIISMLAPQTRSPLQAVSVEEAAAIAAKAKAYSRMKMQAHHAWMNDINTKIKLKRAAIAALPPDLQEAAKQEDVTPFPLTRHYYYQTPPEAYRS
jgi:hypothetical protein